MTKKAIKCLVWFVVGQLTQIIIAMVAKVSYMNRPIWFCAAAGFLVTVAIFAGVRLAVTDEKKALTYMDYAEGRHD